MSKINETKVYKQDTATVVELEVNYGVTGVKLLVASAYYSKIRSMKMIKNVC